MADLFLSLGAEVPEQLSLKLPPNVVEGSARASFSVLGESPALVDYSTILTVCAIFLYCKYCFQNNNCNLTPFFSPFLGTFIASNHTSVHARLTFPKSPHFSTSHNNLFLLNDSDRL